MIDVGRHIHREDENAVDHSRSDGHAHRHEIRSEERLDCVSVGIAGYEHEGVAVVSCSMEPNKGCEIPFSRITGILEDTASALEAAGGFIGHIKGHAQCDQGEASFSMVDASLPAALKGDPGLMLGYGSSIEMVLIVACLAPSEVAGIFKDLIRSRFS